MNLRIGDRDSLTGAAVRDGTAVRRTRTALSDVDGAPDGDAQRRDIGVVVRLSSQARKLMAERDGEAMPPIKDSRSDQRDATGASADAERADPRSAPADGDAAKKTAGTGGPKKLTNEDKELVSRLAARDTAVRAHEAAHQAAARGLGGAASFSYETGPDGRRYAVGGEVPVSIRPGRTPQETIANAQVVRSAALAPADPSSQDMAVASQAAQMEAEARQQITKTKAEGGERDPLTNARIDNGDRDPVTGARKTPDAEGRDPVGAAKPTDGTAEAKQADGQGGARKAAKVTTATATDADPAAKPEPEKVDGGDRDPLMIFSALKAERGFVNGHAHGAGAGGCSFCSRAAARYA